MDSYRSWWHLNGRRLRYNSCKKNLKNISEIKVADYLLALRKKNKLFYSLSFDTISAFGKHSALPHYRVSKNSNYQLKKNNIYFVIVNAENSFETGVGLSKEICEDFFRCGVNVITTGNHVWDQKDIMNFIDKETRLLRPKNLF